MRAAGLPPVPQRPTSWQTFLNAHWGAIAQDECLDRIVPIGERHLRRSLAEYVEHYHRERNHQGLSNRLIAGRPAIDRANRVRRRPRLGGLLNF